MMLMRLWKNPQSILDDFHHSKNWYSLLKMGYFRGAVAEVPLAGIWAAVKILHCSLRRTRLYYCWYLSQQAKRRGMPLIMREGFAVFNQLEVQARNGCNPFLSYFFSLLFCRFEEMTPYRQMQRVKGKKENWKTENWKERWEDITQNYYDEIQQVFIGAAFLW